MHSERSNRQTSVIPQWNTRETIERFARLSIFVLLYFYTASRSILLGGVVALAILSIYVVIDSRRRRRNGAEYTSYAIVVGSLALSSKVGPEVLAAMVIVVTSVVLGLVTVGVAMQYQARAARIWFEASSVGSVHNSLPHRNPRDVLLNPAVTEVETDRSTRTSGKGHWLVKHVEIHTPLLCALMIVSGALFLLTTTTAEEIGRLWTLNLIVTAIVVQLCIAVYIVLMSRRHRVSGSVDHVMPALISKSAEGWLWGATMLTPVLGYFMGENVNSAVFGDAQHALMLGVTVCSGAVVGLAAIGLGHRRSGQDARQ